MFSVKQHKISILTVELNLCSTYTCLEAGLLVEKAVLSEWADMVKKKCDVSVAVSFGAEKEIVPAGTSGRESGAGKRSVEVCEM